MRRAALLSAAVILALAGCGSQDATLARRCHAQAYASAARWTDGYLARFDPQASEATRSGLMDPLVSMGTRQCEAHPDRYLP